MATNIAGYIQHHLVHWQWSPVGDTNSFWTFNVDTILVSIACGLTFLYIFRYVALNASVSNPGRLQLAVESVVEMVDDQVKEVVGKRDTAVCSLALSIFMWIWLMNFMDLIPVDLLPFLASKLDVHFFRAVPTADLSMNFALSLGVLFMIHVESMKVHGFKDYIWEILSHPFSIYLFPVNVAIRILEEFAKPLSLAMRLFGNMFAGEMVFFLIAVSPIYLQWIAGWFWLGLHILIITLQAYIFMLLTIIYIGIARNSSH